MPTGQHRGVDLPAGTPRDPLQGGWALVAGYCPRVGGPTAASDGRSPALPWTSEPAQRRLQALQRSAGGGEGARHRGPLPASPRGGAGPLRRQEEPHSGTGPYPAAAATSGRGPSARPMTAMAAGLPPCSPPSTSANIGAGEVIGDLHLRHRSTEFPSFLQRIDAGGPRQVRRSPGTRQLRYARASFTPPLAVAPSPVSAALHPDLFALDQRGRVQVRSAYAAPYPTGVTPGRACPGGPYPRPTQGQERAFQALHLGQDR